MINKSKYFNFIVIAQFSLRAGDYIVAGVFRMGSYVVREKVTNETTREVEYCSHSHPKIYGVQRAIAFRKTMEAARESFR